MLGNQVPSRMSFHPKLNAWVVPRVIHTPTLKGFYSPEQSGLFGFFKSVYIWFDGLNTFNFESNYVYVSLIDNSIKIPLPIVFSILYFFYSTLTMHGIIINGNLFLVFFIVCLNMVCRVEHRLFF